MRFFVFSVLRDAPARLFSPYMRHDSCVRAANPEEQKNTAAPFREPRCKSKSSRRETTLYSPQSEGLQVSFGASGTFGKNVTPTILSSSATGIISLLVTFWPLRLSL